jgi:hypothetical protein
MLRFDRRIAQEPRVGDHGHELLGVHRVPSAQADLSVVNL